MVRATSQAALWDMDGTLVDTGDLHYRAWIKLTRDLRLPFTRADFEATFGWRNPEIIRKLFGQHYTEAEVAEIGARKEEYYRASAKERGVVLLPGARTLLDGLAAAGFQQAIGSSAPRENVDLILELTQTEHLFQGIVSMEDTQRGKPDPQVFLIAAKKVGVAPVSCVVIEDAVVGVQAAKAGGMKCIAVTFAGHHPAPRLQEAGADLIASSLAEVSVGKVLRLLEDQC